MAEHDDPERPMGIDWTRRRFLAASLGGGTSLLGAGISAAEPDLRIRARRKLGRTGIEIPDIAMGSFALDSGEDLVLHALDRGITHFDTAESYAGGRAEEVLGRALRGRRSEVTLTSKFSASPGHTAAQQMTILERSLAKLQTDHVDVYLNHAVNERERLDSEAWQTFVLRAKRDGKIRAAGMSGHAGRLSECLAHGLDAKLLDVILVAYNFAQQPSYRDEAKRYFAGLSSSFDFVSPQPDLPALLARARAAEVGVQVMKTLKGARLNDMRPFESGGRTFAHAAFRWVLSDPAVDGLVVTMTSRAQIDEYVAASGSGPPDREDLALLARYEARHAASSCTVGCGDCADVCPAGVPIADVLRTRMYALDYRLPAAARQEYARLARDASACLRCSGAPCANACSRHLSIATLARDTHVRLAANRVPPHSPARTGSEDET